MNSYIKIFVQYPQNRNVYNTICVDLKPELNFFNSCIVIKLNKNKCLITELEYYLFNEHFEKKKILCT